MFKIINAVKFLAIDPVLSQQKRTTFILKRRYDVLLHAKNKKPYKLRAKDFIYDLIEDTSTKPRANLEVVLTQFVDGIGDKGDVVSVKRSVAYNKLLLPKLAVYKTPENIEKYSRPDSEKNEILHSSPFAERTVNGLQRRILSVTMNKDHPWVVEPWHIRVALRKAGFHVKDECITLPEQPIQGPDLLKQNKEFYVTITVNNLEKARVRCRLNHWSTEPSNRLPYVFQYWKEPSEPLFGNTEENSTRAE